MIRIARVGVAFLLLACALAAPAQSPPAPPAPPRDVADEAALRIVAAMEKGGWEGLWNEARALADLGMARLLPLSERRAQLAPLARLGLAQALIWAGQPRPGLGQMRELALDAGLPPPVRLASVRIIASAGRREDAQGLLDAARTEAQSELRIALAQAAYAKGREAGATSLLKGLLASTDGRVRAQAAVALGQIGNVEAAKSELEAIRHLPTREGELANELLLREQLMGMLGESGTLNKDETVLSLRAKIQELEQALTALKERLTQGGGGDAGDLELVAEIKEAIERHYVNAQLAEPRRLLEAAARGMAGSLDPFSSFMDEATTEEFDSSMSGEYVGIGAIIQVDPSDGLPTIIRPIYSGPAFQAGLRSLDKILRVEGLPTTGKDLRQVIEKIKGAPGTNVTVTVGRAGWSEPRDFTIARREIQLDSVTSRLLPAGIGYLALSQFGDKAVQEVELALTRMEQAGLKALVLDLRANPGGLLSAAVAIADMFLAEGKLIVYSEGRDPELAPRREFRTEKATTHPPFPVFVLVNQASASASEIVAGALQDHRRATLIGTRTFGKGSVQQLIPLKSTGSKTRLRLTIAYYYLPSGRSIHEKGVDPDIAVKDVPFEFPLDAAQAQTVQQGLRAYLAEVFPRQAARFRELAEHDGGRLEAYPEFDPTQRLPAGTDSELARRLLRAEVRRRVEDDRGSPLGLDLQEDPVLQTAVLEALRALGESQDTHDLYRVLTPPPREPAPPAPQPEKETSDDHER